MKIKLGKDKSQTQKMNKGESVNKTSEGILLEKLADLEHYQWSQWTAYFLDNLTDKNRKRWKLQALTPYCDLTGKEKESDRIWARKVIEVINKQEYIRQIIKEAKIDQCKFDNSNIQGMSKTLKNALEVSKEQEKQIREFKEMAKLCTKQKILEIIMWMPFEFHKESSYSFKQVCEILGMFRDEVADKVKVLK